MAVHSFGPTVPWLNPFELTSPWPRPFVVGVGRGARYDAVATEALIDSAVKTAYKRYRPKAYRLGSGQSGINSGIHSESTRALVNTATLRSSTARNAEIAKYLAAIDAHQVPDDLSESLKTVARAFRTGIESGLCNKLFFGKCLKLLKRALRDPLSGFPLDESAVLGNDGKTYSPKTLELYQNRGYFHSPYFPKNPAPLEVIPHPLVPLLVRWVKKYEFLIQSIQDEPLPQRGPSARPPRQASVIIEDAPASASAPPPGRPPRQASVIVEDALDSDEEEMKASGPPPGRPPRQASVIIEDAPASASAPPPGRPPRQASVIVEDAPASASAPPPGRPPRQASVIIEDAPASASAPPPGRPPRQASVIVEDAPDSDEEQIEDNVAAFSEGLREFAEVLEEDERRANEADRQFRVNLENLGERDRAGAAELNRRMEVAEREINRLNQLQVELEERQAQLDEAIDRVEVAQVQTRSAVTKAEKAVEERENPWKILGQVALQIAVAIICKKVILM